MGLVLVQGPQEPVVDLATVKRFLHVDTASDDDRIVMLVDAATARLDGRDGILGRALMPQTWRLEMAAWPVGLVLPLPPLIGVTSIVYLDPLGAELTLATDQYRVVNTGAAKSYVVPAIGVTWPNLQESVPDAVRVTFDAGYRGASSPENNAIPETIRQAIIMMVQAWYDKPAIGDIPEVVNSLVSPHKANRLGVCYG